MGLMQDRYYIDIVNPSAYITPGFVTVVRCSYTSRMGENLSYSKDFKSVTEAKYYADTTARLFPFTEDWEPVVEMSLLAAIMLEKERNE